MTLLISCWTRRLRWTVSASIGRMAARARRGIVRYRRYRLALDAVHRARLLALGDPGRVERPANHLVADARQVLDAAAAYEDDRVLLKIVALARDVARHFHPVGEANTSDLAQS